MDAQTIRFTEVGGRNVAWATAGEGPPLILGGWWMSHLELNWRDDAFRGFCQALARHRTLIRYDSPGIGLSGPGGPPLQTLAEELAVLEAVADAAGVESADLFAASAGGPVALAYAAAHPQRVRRLVLYGTYASGAGVADAAARDSILAVIRQHWGLGSRVLGDIFMPTASAPAREAFVDFQREAAGAELAAASLEAVYGFDVSDRLGEVRAPALVLHRREDRAIPFGLGQELAAKLPDATFVALEGADHFPWVGASGEVAQAVLGGLGVEVSADELDLPMAAEAAPAAPEETPTADGDLSPRELEVLRLVALGLSDRDIAERLVLSPHTVHRHVANIRTKLRLPSRAAAAAQAARMGLL